MSYTAEWTDLKLSRAEVEGLPGATVLEFGVAWCPHCQNVQSTLEQVLKDRPGIRHLKAEDGKGRALGRAFGVKLWPNFVLLGDGQVVRQMARPQLVEIPSAIAELASVVPRPLWRIGLDTHPTGESELTRGQARDPGSTSLQGLLTLAVGSPDETELRTAGGELDEVGGLGAGLLPKPH